MPEIPQRSTEERVRVQCPEYRWLHEGHLFIGCTGSHALLITIKTKPEAGIAVRGLHDQLCERTTEVGDVMAPATLRAPLVAGSKLWKVRVPSSRDSSTFPRDICSLVCR